MVGKEHARSVRFRIDMSGEATWSLSGINLIEIVQRVKPDMVTVVDDEARALLLADELRQKGQADTVILLHPDPAAVLPSQQHIVLPESLDPSNPKDLMINLARSLIQAQSKGLLNPLTGLPGATVLHKEVNRRLSKKKTISFLYIDIDNFKSFNDYYGFARGDEVISLLSNLIKTTISQHGTPSDLCIHIGGDDFGVLTEPDRAQKIADSIICEFDMKTPSMYDEKERVAGFFLTKDRQGKEARFPLMTVSIAGISNQNRQIANSIELSEIAAEMKGYAKLIPGSSYVQDRRRV